MRLTNFFGSLLVAVGWPASVIAQSSPYSHTQVAAPITAASATLNGMVQPNGAETLAWFEWATTDQAPQRTAPTRVGNGLAVVRVSAGVSNLPPFSTFQCRLVASNLLGVTTGAVIRFTTGQRVTQWGATSDGQMPVASGLSNAVSIAAGHFHSLALTADGRVVAWGQNSAGQSVVPAGLDGATAVAAGGYHNLVLRPDGKVEAWGRNTSDQTNVPAGLSNVVAIAGGYDHCLALTAGAKVMAWGENTGGQATVPTDLSNVVAVAAGGFHSLALKADGTVVAWGESYSGQTNVPVGLTNVVAIAAGNGSSYAITADGTLITWPDSNSVPPNLGPVAAAEGGGYHSLVLKGNRTAVAWGIDYVGITNVPAGLSNVTAVAAGGYHSLALGNLPPQAQAQHLSGVAGQDLTITLAGSDSNSDVLQFAITALPTHGSLYQWTPGGRGAAIVSPGTLIIDGANRVILAQPIAAHDSFAFSVNDGLQDSAAATVLVDTVPARAFTHRPHPTGTAAAKLGGMVLAAGPMQVWFEWSEIGGISQSTVPIPVAGDGTLAYVTTIISNLAARANFQCRLVASNRFGMSYGRPNLFTTGRRLYGWGGNGNGQLNIPAELTNVVFTAAGWHNSFAIRADGTALGWGWNSFGQATPPLDLTNAVDIAAGYFHGVALRADGTVGAWGNNAFGQTNVPAGLSNVVEVSAAYAHSLALKSDGTVVTWGEFGGASQTNQPPGLSNVVAIAGSLFCDVALKADGTVVAWGTDNGGGVTIIPPDLINVVSLSAGEYHCLALKSDGTVVAWGRNTSGPATVPPGLSNVVGISAGGNQSVALQADGAIVAWGSITTAKGNVVSGLTNMVLTANGSGHGLALGNLMPQVQARNHSALAGADLTVTLPGSDPDGDALRYRITTLPAAGNLYQWTAGGRGSPITTNETWVEDAGGRILYARPVSGSESFTFVANDDLVDSTNATVSVTISPAWVSTQPTRPAGASAAVLRGAAVAISPTEVWFEWGEVGAYEHTTAEISLPADGQLTRLDAFLTNLVERVNYQCRLVSSNASGVVHGAPVWFTTGRKVIAWGRNNFGQTNVPASLSHVVNVAGGVNHSLALRSDGSVVAWGFGANGETNVPTGLTDVVAVAGGANHSLALRADRTVAAWGLGTSGQTNVPPGLSNVAAIAAGYDHSLALRADGTIAAWGANTFDQFSSGQTTVAPGLSNVVEVAAGGGHNLALRADGTVVAWGYNSSGQTNVPPALGNVVAVAAGRTHSLALKSDGVVVAWGSARNSQITVPAAASNVVAIAAGESHSLALRADGTLVAWGDNLYGQRTIPAGLHHGVTLSAGGFHNLVLGNLPPQVQSQTNVGSVAQDLILQLPASDPNDDPLTRRIVSPPFLGALYQWSPGGRGAAITSPHTVVNDPQGRVIFAGAPDGEGWPYSTLSYEANDGETNSSTALVTVNLVPPPVLEITRLAPGANGEFSFRFDGDTNATARIWVSTNLTTWSVLGSATQSPPGEFSFTDVATTNWPSRFYRVTIP